MANDYDAIVVGARYSCCRGGCGAAPAVHRHRARRRRRADNRKFAGMAPPPPETQQLLAALRGNDKQISRFLGVTIGWLPAEEFFAPDNIAQIMSAARVA